MLQWANYQKDKTYFGKSSLKFVDSLNWPRQKYLKKILSKEKIILPLIHHFVIIPIDFSDGIIVKVVNISHSTK